MSLVLFHKIRKVDVDLVRVVSKSKHWTWNPKSVRSPIGKGSAADRIFWAQLKCWLCRHKRHEDRQGTQNQQISWQFQHDKNGILASSGRP